MKTIYKYPVPIRDELTLLLPQNPLVLCVQLQDEVPCIWAEITTESRLVGRKFFWRGTGHPMTGKEGRYIGTIQVSRLVFHLFAESGLDVGIRPERTY